MTLSFLTNNVFALILQYVRVTLSFWRFSMMKDEFILSILFGAFMHGINFVKSVLQIMEFFVYSKGSNLRYTLTYIYW